MDKLCNSPLTVEIVIGPLFNQATVVDSNLFAADIRLELLRKDEDGSTLIHRMFDVAAQDAADNGSEGVRFEGDNE